VKRDNNPEQLQNTDNKTLASQPINEGGQSPGAPRSKGPPSATSKNLCH